MEFLPDTLRSVTLRYQKKRKRFPIEHVKVYMMQMLKAMEYIHGRKICHRDIKPDNLLVDTATLRLKLCDFGCSKVLVKGQPNISYICSRYYRAPELLFGATDYTCALDLWSIGTILAELLLGHLPFQGQDSTQQHLVEIMKLLGAPPLSRCRGGRHARSARGRHSRQPARSPPERPSAHPSPRRARAHRTRPRRVSPRAGTPSSHELQAMGAACTADDLPKLKPFPWDRVFPPGTPADAIDLVSKLLCYNPETRLNAQQALAHPFLAGVEIASSLGSADPGAANGVSARTAQELGAATAAYVDDLAAKQGTFDTALISSLEASLLAAIKAAGLTDAAAHAAVQASVRAELKGAAASLERRKHDNLDAAFKMQQRVAAIAAEGAPAGGAIEVDADGGKERERLQASLASVAKQLEESKAAQARSAEQLRSAQTKMQQLEAECAMSAVAIHDGAHGHSVATGSQVRARAGHRPHCARARRVARALAHPTCTPRACPPLRASRAQTEDDLMSEPRDASKDGAGFGRRAPGRSYITGFFGNTGIVPSPLLKRPTALTTPGGRPANERGEGSDGTHQAIMDGGQNLGLVRPQGAMSPCSSCVSPSVSASKWGIGRPSTGAACGGGSIEATQPPGSDMMPSNRRSMRCAARARRRAAARQPSTPGARALRAQRSAPRSRVRSQRTHRPAHAQALGQRELKAFRMPEWRARLATLRMPAARSQS
jgi:DNA-binding protein YbaB